MLNFKDKSLNSPTFCIMPFSHITTKTTGEIKLCCRSHPLYNVNEKSLLEVWNSEKIKRIRKQMLSGERPPECEICYSLEDKNITSMRQRQNKMKFNRETYIGIMDELNDDYSMPNKIRSIELKLNNLCNLKCRMCHPVDSTKWAEDWSLVAELQRHNEWTYKNVKKYNLTEHPYLCEWENHPTFFDELNEIIETVDTIWFAGGEPLIDPMHYKFLNMIKDKGKTITLQYATNLTKLSCKDESIIDLWKSFKKILVAVSFDGVADVYEYIRTNANFNEVVDNIKTIQNKIEKESMNIILLGGCTFQAYNIFNLPDMFNFLIDNNIWIHTHRVSFPRFLSCQVLPKELKEVASKNIQSFLDNFIKRKKELETDVYKNTISHTTDVLNFLNAYDLSREWPNFLEYSRILDKATYSKPLEEVIPEIGRYLNDK